MQISSSSSQLEISSVVSMFSFVIRIWSFSVCNKWVGMYLEGFDFFNQLIFNNVMEQNFKNCESYLEDMVFYIFEDYKFGIFFKVFINGSFFFLGNNSFVNWRIGSFYGFGYISFRRENSSDNFKELKRCNFFSFMSSCLSIYDNVLGFIFYFSLGDLVDLENEDIFFELDDIFYYVKGMQWIVNQWLEKFFDEGDLDLVLDLVFFCLFFLKQIYLDVDND